MNLGNDKEFDNLFKRAADNFPLNTDSADWNAVLEQLEEKKDRKFLLFRKRYLGLLLLFITTILVSSIITKFIVHDSLVDRDKKQFTINKDEKQIETQLADNLYKKILDSINKNNTAFKKEEKQITKTLIANTNDVANKKNNSTFSTIKNVKKTSLKNNNTSNNINSKQDNYSAKKADTKDDLTSNNIVSNSSGNNNTTIYIDNKNKQQQLNTVKAKKDDTVSTVFLKKSNTDTKKDSILSNEKTVKKNTPKVSHFYTGLLYATDASAVNLKPTNKKGYSIALMLGYRFNKTISLETGFHLEKKEYYSTGEHFDKTILNATGKVNWIEAENKLIEIPITIKVDFFNKNKHNLFGSFGLSSYIINKEIYEYEEEIGGVLQEGMVIYTKNTSNLFTTFNFSLGYQFNFGKLGNARIEPYVNIPIQGIGKGKEPVISRGIYFGWIYDFPKRKLKH